MGLKKIVKEEQRIEREKRGIQPTYKQISSILILATIIGGVAKGIYSISKENRFQIEQTIEANKVYTDVLDSRQYVPLFEQELKKPY